MTDDNQKLEQLNTYVDTYLKDRGLTVMPPAMIVYLAARGAKRCSTCKTVKDIGEFYKNKNRKDGLNNQCKSCVNRPRPRPEWDSWFTGPITEESIEEWAFMIRELGRQTIPKVIAIDLESRGLRWCASCASVLPIPAFGRKTTCKECESVQARRWRERAGDKALEIGRKGSASYRQRHPWQERLYNGYHRAIKVGAYAERITEEQLLTHWERVGIDPGKCAYTGVPLTPANRSLDHVIPLNLADGPGHQVANLLPTTKEMNTHKKRNRHVLPFRAVALGHFNKERNDH